MPLFRTRLYYGWVVVALAFITMSVVMGTLVSSGVLFAALIEEYGWSRSTTALPFSIGLVVYAATAWVSGRLFDLYGPRRLFPLGALCLGLGLIATASARNSWQLCLTWGLLVSQGFNLVGFVPHLTLISLWFHRKRGMASGIALSGASIGGLVIVPVMQYLVNQYGWRPAYTLLGMTAMVCLAPINAWWQRHRPADLGLHPDGHETPPARLTREGSNTRHPSWPLGRALHTPQFWFLFAMVCTIGWLSNLIGVHLIAHITDNGFSNLLAASIVSLMGLLRAGSSMLWGGLSDRFGRELVYTWGTVLCVSGLAGLAVLQRPEAVWLLYGSILAYGLGYGVHGAVEATAVADLFHGPYLGTILGTLEIGWGLGGFAGAWFGGFWFDAWGGYHGAFALTVGVSVLGCVSLWLAAPRRPVRQAAGGVQRAE